MKLPKLRRQKPIRGGRDPLPSCVIHAIRTAVEDTARQFECSRSFVIATVLADAFGVELDSRYDDLKPKRRAR